MGKSPGTLPILMGDNSFHKKAEDKNVGWSA